MYEIWQKRGVKNRLTCALPFRWPICLWHVWWPITLTICIYTLKRYAIWCEAKTACSGLNSRSQRMKNCACAGMQRPAACAAFSVNSSSSWIRGRQGGKWYNPEVQSRFEIPKGREDQGEKLEEKRCCKLWSADTSRISWGPNATLSTLDREPDEALSSFIASKTSFSGCSVEGGEADLSWFSSIGPLVECNGAVTHEARLLRRYEET